MSRYDPNEIEKRVELFWKHQDIEDKARGKSRAQEKPFFFMDGPPYASGSIHMGTAWNKILKDAYMRFFRMKGLNVWNQPGYDTHGTPIEVKVEKELGFENKKDIEKFGVDKFIKKCKEFATKHIEIMNKQFANLGVWMDWENPYLTLNNRYIEGAWYTFKKAHEKGLLYKGKYPVHVCSRCATAVAYNEIEYKKLIDESVFVKFALKGEKNKFFVIWTTTPWTLPANTGIMTHPNYEYSFVKVGSEEWILAKDLVEPLLEKFDVRGKIVKTVKGKDLEGLEYDHPLKEEVNPLKNLKNGHKVVNSARFVNLESGTGLVHTAPGHGKEDYIVGKKEGLPVLSFVNIDGTYSKEAGKWLEGKHVKKANKEIVKKLEEKNVLVFKEPITHDYPTCWRCDTPLLFITVPQWFFKITDIRDKLLSENKKVNWYPKWAKNRFDDWLKNLSDWPVSRQRYWGTPLPIWECECNRIEVIGSYDELAEKGGLKKEIDFHIPEIDTVKIKCKCGKEMKRVPDVLDVWFDSGVGTWASLDYPRFKEAFNTYWPSDLQIEGTDQFRGWWNAQIITSIMSFNKAPFKNVIVHAMVMDLKGSKMSKSKGNIVSPEEVIEKYGRDVMRFYLLSSEPWNDFYWNWEEIKEDARMFNIFWNIFNFVKTYGADVRGGELKPEDRWIISRINNLTKKQKKIEDYQLHEFVQSIKDFIINDFSRFYIKLIRDRISPFYEGKDKIGAQETLNYVIRKLIGLMAPITPYITDYMHNELHGKDYSIHLEDYPEAEDDLIDKKLEDSMNIVKEILEAIFSLRNDKKIKLKWPVSHVTLSLDEKTKKKIKGLEDVIKFMGNLEEVRYGKAKEKSFIYGKLDLGDVLKDGALVRELIRYVQILRKEAKLMMKDTINLNLETDKETEKILKKHEKAILLGVGSKKMELSIIKKEKGNLEFEGKRIKIDFKKV